MVVVMAAEAGETEVDGVVDRVRAAGGDAFVSRGRSRTIVGLVGDVDQLDTLNLRGMPGVSDVVRISAPYKLVSREHHRERSVIRVGGVPIGPDTLTAIAGPCALDTAHQTLPPPPLPSAAPPTPCCASAAPAPSRRPPGTPSTSARCPSRSGYRTCP